MSKYMLVIPTPKHMPSYNECYRLYMNYIQYPNVHVYYDLSVDEEMEIVEYYAYREFIFIFVHDDHCSPERIYVSQFYPYKTCLNEYNPAADNSPNYRWYEDEYWSVKFILMVCGTVAVAVMMAAIGSI